MVEEKGFNNLNSKEQWELIGLIDKLFFERGEYYSRESPGVSLVYLQQAESVRKQLKARFGNVLQQ